jgi:hypothetical protein
MIIAENSRFEEAQWMPYSPKASWTLSPGRGIKTLYMKLRGAGCPESHSLASSIFLDATPILNLVQPMTPADVPEPRRRLQIALDGSTLASDLKLVYYDGTQSLYFDSLEYPDLWLPDTQGCLYVYGRGRQPVVHLVGVGDLVISVLEKIPELREDQFWISGCVLQALEDKATVVLVVDQETIGRTAITPEMPSFSLLGQRGAVTVQLVDEEGRVLSQEAAHMAPAYSIDRTFIVELKPGHVEDLPP